MGVALEQRLPGLNCTFVDIHPVPVRDGRVLKGWENYVQFDGKNLPFEKLQFDVGIFSDVLHHVPDEIRDVLLMNALKKCRFVIIKDHFEYGFFTRTILRGMDFVGNFGYGVSVPSEYFNEERFAAFCERAHAQVVDVDVGVELYRHLPVLRSLLSPKLHFIAVCQLRNVVD